MRVCAPNPDVPDVELLAGGDGRWTTREGETLPELECCVDVDISAIPFTNTSPIRRLELVPGRSAELDVAFVHVPDLRVTREMQRYERTKHRSDGGLYRFGALPSGFTAELTLGPDGLVIDYPGLFRQAWPD